MIRVTLDIICAGTKMRGPVAVVTLVAVVVPNKVVVVVVVVTIAVGIEHSVEHPGEQSDEHSPPIQIGVGSQYCVLRTK